MRIRIAAMLSFLVVIGMSIPATAAPDQSPAFEEVPTYYEVVLPNPCLGEGVEELYIFEGVTYIHEQTNPSGNYHYNDYALWSVQTESGFYAAPKMVGVGLINESNNAYILGGVGNYQLRNEAGQKLRLQVHQKIRIIGDEVKVDTFDFDLTCLGNK